VTVSIPFDQGMTAAAGALGAFTGGDSHLARASRVAGGNFPALIEFKRALFLPLLGEFFAHKCRCLFR
jgi:hypothetical protein